MKAQRPVRPGWFFRNRRQYLALSEVPRTLNIPSQEVQDAVTLGELQIERISGCKAVAVNELFHYIDMRGGKR
ncbi:hypothetical protein C8D92_102231 [Tamilnaduibacter salinus]|uniref:DNA-binding protein n=1 Tax=Tamilnaduibacter salinus TaxID=1484056 RepID=A0A2U1CZQ8_9GAMM|nr:hypothetical protein [Tamilnaduibacter salinus]PVY78191.1 hypothetical protein C8D92_102231 [Tamilnaduibacter salinus]